MRRYGYSLNPTKAENILARAVRPCMTREEAIGAAQSIERSLESIERRSSIRGSHKKGILQLLWWARTAKTPKDRIRWISQAQDMLKPLKARGPGSRKLPREKDPRLGRLMGAAANPPLRHGAKVTWSEEALELDMGRPGLVLRVSHSPEPGRTVVVLPSGRTTEVNNWQIELIRPGVRPNPWFSPEAIQYVSRFTGNPPPPLGRNPADAYYDEDSEFGHHCPEDPRETCWICGGRGVEKNPWFSPEAIQYVSRFTGNPPPPRCQCGRPLSDQDLRHGYGTCGHCARGHVPEGSRYGHNPGLPPHPFTEWKEPYGKGYGELDYLQGYNHVPGWDVSSNPMACHGYALHCRDEPDHSPGLSRPIHEYIDNPEDRHDVLCQCGWGLLQVPESEIPERCPVCGHALFQGGDDDPYEDNPKYFTMGHGAVARPYSRGVLRRTMETDPMHESRMRNMLQHYGSKSFGLDLTDRQIESMVGKSPKDLGGRTATAKRAVRRQKVPVGRGGGPKAQRVVTFTSVKKGQKVKLADVKRRVDAIFYSQSRRMGTLEGVSISEDTTPEPAKRSRPAPKKRAPVRKRAKKTSGRKRRAG